ncbi:MAG: CHASE2 domain-containing protein [Bacteroidia bacterium]
MKAKALVGWLSRLALVSGGAFLLDYLFPPSMWGWRIHDLVYKRLPPAEPDTQIVIVDIARLDRAELARLLLRLAEYQPRFIGIDAVFSFLGTPEIDQAWEAALCSVAVRIPVCLVSSLEDTPRVEQAAPRAVSAAPFLRCVETAYANLILQEAYASRTVREFLPYTVANGDTHYSLGLRVALALDTTLYHELSAWQGIQPIRFRGNLDHFYSISGEEVLRDSLALPWIKGKAILMGFSDPIRLSMEDIFFTPLGLSFLRPSFPDMYGVVIHANIASMLVHRWRYLQLSVGWSWALLVLGYGLISLLSRYLDRVRLRWVGVRLLQGLLIWVGIELTLLLAAKGCWLAIEPYLWGVLLAGEVEIGGGGRLA